MDVTEPFSSRILVASSEAGAGTETPGFPLVSSSESYTAGSIVDSGTLLLHVKSEVPQIIAHSEVLRKDIMKSLTIMQGQF